MTEKQPHSSEIILTPQTDFRVTVRQLMWRLGGDIGYGNTLLLGEDQNYSEDDERTVFFPKEVGKWDSREIVIESENFFDENDGVFRTKTKYAYCREFYFGPDLKNYFELLISLLPAKEFSRVLEANDRLTILIYDSFTKKEAASFLEQIEPPDSGIIGFTQGEWVLVDGEDPNHRIASYGRNSDGCRYWLIYDPVRKKAAASHLDLTVDIEAVEEMVSALVRAGSTRNDLMVHSSPNVPDKAKSRIEQLFPTIIFDLDDHAMVFDVQTGELGYPDKSVMDEIVQDKSGYERLIRNFDVRLKYKIGQVLAYRSPGV